MNVIYLFLFFISIQSNEQYEIQHTTLTIKSNIEDNEFMNYPWNNEKYQIISINIKENVEKIPFGRRNF